MSAAAMPDEAVPNVSAVPAASASSAADAYVPMTRVSVARGLGGVDTRERRTIVAGVAVVAIALSLTYGVAPFARRWSEREDLLAARREQLARVRALVRDEPALARAVRAREQQLVARPRRPLGARNAALAAAALQSLVQDYAARSHVQLTRVDVANTDAAAPSDAAPPPNATAGALPEIPATVAALGDVYGLANFLALIERGPRSLAIADLAVQTTRGARGEALLQLSITLRVPYAPLEAP